ncbi:tRNA/rRNA methyltransferase [Crocosphaera subtropica ATCC 51142]|uniref:tRNA/rRNA methyltransferase n=1 Tax=Crocosphaera subtropica (strain ATCC 51142 / BH68) TaxID=43989 RepID=B1WNB1_CROS5|nr:RNA methyltransferase [Crocosphaera subtropica]ACB49753.1 tRNA/rRNA methyltransferase [Crocosphaera subtropica ATCC 51142]
MITSIRNPLIKQIRKLHRTKGRREHNLLLLEGTHLVETAYKENCSLITLCYTEEWQARYPQLWESVSKRVKRSELVSADVLASMTTTVNPDGVVATARFQPRTEEEITDFRLGLIIERLQDPGNLGTIIRTAAAVEIDAIWLSDDSVEIDNPKVLRASAGAWFQVPIFVTSDLTTVIKKHKNHGVNIVATLPNATETYWQLQFTQPTLILLGNEGSGLSNSLIALADELVSIPLSQGVESLNVAIATALLLYEAKRQKIFNS